MIIASLATFILQAEPAPRGGGSFITTELFLLILPLIIGLVLILVNSETVVNSTERFKNWLATKKEKLATRRGKIARYLIRPLVFLLIKVSEWTDGIKHAGVKSGIRIASYIYIIEIFVFVLVVLGYILLILALIIVGLWIIFWILGRVLGGPREKVEENVYVESVKREPTFFESLYPFVTTEQENLKNLFKVDEIEIEEDGKIYTENYKQFPSKEKIGFIDEEGQIYDIRGTARKSKIGHIDKYGHVKEEWKIIKD